MEIKDQKKLMFSMLQDMKSPSTELKYRTEKRTCPIHNKIYEVKIFEDGTEEGCPICAEEKGAELKRKRLEEQNEQWRKEKENYDNAVNVEACKKLNISPEFYFSKLEDYIPKTNAQAEAKKAVAEMIEERSGKIILLGSNGAGKTMLASIVAKELKGCVYTMYEIATMIRQSYTAKAEKSELEIVRDLVELPFLAIDEVGRIANSEAVQNWFSFILDKRHSRKLPTIIIGNLHFNRDCEQGGCPRCFENYFDKDVLSRFHEDTTVIQIKAPDERKGKKTMKYFTD